MADPNCDPNSCDIPILAGPTWEDPGPPEATEDNLICLRGPCRHLWQTTSRFDAINNEDHAGIQKRFCLRHPGDPDPDITDERIYECSEWDVDVAQISRRARLRAEWNDHKIENPNNKEQP